MKRIQVWVARGTKIVIRALHVISLASEFFFLSGLVLRCEAGEGAGWEDWTNGREGESTLGGEVFPQKRRRTFRLDGGE